MEMHDHLANGFAGALFFFVFLYFLARYMRRLKTSTQLEPPVLPVHFPAVHQPPPYPHQHHHSQQQFHHQHHFNQTQPPPAAPPSYEEAVRLGMPIEVKRY